MGKIRNRSPWIAALRGGRRALDTCELLIGDVRRVLRVSDRFGTARPIRAFHQLDPAGGWLVDAGERLGHAIGRLNIAVSLLESTPWDGAGAPQALLANTRRIIDLGVKLYELSERLSQTSERLVKAAKRVGHGEPLPPPSRPMPPRRFLLHPSEPVILKQRERPPPPAPEDAPRRVSRGRAPPFIDLPPLSTAVRNTKGDNMSNDTEVKVSHTEAAQTLIETVRGIRATVPNFVIPATKADRWRMNRAASVPADFIETAAVAVKNNPALVRGGADADPDTVRDLLSFAEAYDPVADELEALAKFLRHSTKAARARAASEALLTYEVAKRLAKQRATADLAPVRDAMKRTLGAKRPKPQQTPDTPPSTPEPPANGS